MELKKLFTIVTYNESRTVLLYAQVSFRQLELILPFYVVGILVNGLSHVLSIDGKFKKYTFSYITIDSTNCLAVNIGLKRFIKLFPAGSFNVLQKCMKPRFSKMFLFRKEPRKPPLLVQKPQ